MGKWPLFGHYFQGPVPWQMALIMPLAFDREEGRLDRPATASHFCSNGRPCIAAGHAAQQDTGLHPERLRKCLRGYLFRFSFPALAPIPDAVERGQDDQRQQCRGDDAADDDDGQRFLNFRAVACRQNTPCPAVGDLRKLIPARARALGLNADSERADDKEIEEKPPRSVGGGDPALADPKRGLFLPARRALADQLLREANGNQANPVDQFILFTGTIESAREGVDLSLCIHINVSDGNFKNNPDAGVRYHLQVIKAR